MKRIIFAVLLVFLSLSVCGAEERKLIVITDEWPPYGFRAGVPGNEYMTGYSTEVILAVLKKMNVGIDDRIKQYPWVRDKMIREGDADLAYNAAASEEREKETYYAYEPLIDSAWSFFIRKEDEGKIKYDSLDDLKGQIIGVGIGYTYTPEFWDYVKKENSFEEVATDEVNIRKLVAKRFNIILLDYINGLYMLKKLGLTDKIVVLPKPLKEFHSYAVFSKRRIEKSFVDQFSAELKAFKATEEYKAIYEKYFGK